MGGAAGRLTEADGSRQCTQLRLRRRCRAAKCGAPGMEAAVVSGRSMDEPEGRCDAGALTHIKHQNHAFSTVPRPTLRCGPLR